CDGNANATRREYVARLPNRLPDKLVFSLTFQRLKEIGSFNDSPGTLLLLKIWLCMLEISSSIWKTLSADGCHPYCNFGGLTREYRI
ncbi:hypothetical protein ALC57_00013, partial [Trachymyrmex cornetzi]